jgi:hypothetical protein
MKIFCITGISQAATETVAAVLQQSGLYFPPTDGEPGQERLGFREWHDYVLQGDSTLRKKKISNPGKFADQFASKLFLGNFSKSHWAWADARSVWALDYWHSFEPHINFILVYTSPGDVLKEAILLGHDADVMSARLEEWQQSARELLFFHHQSQGRSVLVDSADCFVRPSNLIALLTDTWHIPLSTCSSDTSIRNQPEDDLAAFLATKFLEAAPQLTELAEEATASLTVLSPSPIRRRDSLEDLAKAISQLAALREQMDHLLTARRALDSKLANAESLLREKAAIEDTLRGRLDCLSTERITLESQLSGTREALANNQVEMENWYLAAQKEKESSANAQKEVARLESTVQQLLEDLDNRQARVTKLEAANQEQTEKLATLMASAAHPEPRIRETEERNALLLLELHQVQEELETYFLEARELRLRNTAMEDRWTRLSQRFPMLADVSDMHVVSHDRSLQRTLWRCLDLRALGRHWVQLEFATTVIKDCLNVETLQGELDGLRSVSRGGTTTWQLNEILVGLVKDYLESANVDPALPADVMMKASRSALAAIHAESARIRHDQVRLKRVQVNPDYEHLWFELENFSYGQARLDNFEFRLSCANVSPKTFGTHPKLEFPKGCGNTGLENWFHESTDDFGEKLELRFELPNSMDMQIWHRLSFQDQSLVTALLSHLSEWLEEVASCNQLQRDWQHWHGLVKDMQRVLDMQTQAGDGSTESQVMAPLSALSSHGAKARLKGAQ